MKTILLITALLFGIMELPSASAHSSMRERLSKQVDAKIQSLAAENSAYRGCALTAKYELSGILDDFDAVNNSGFRESIIFIVFGGNYIVASYSVMGTKNGVPYIYLGKSGRYVSIPENSYRSLMEILSASRPKNEKLSVLRSFDNQNVQCSFVLFIHNKRLKVFQSVSDNRSLDFDLIRYFSSEIDRIAGDN